MDQHMQINKSLMKWKIKLKEEVNLSLFADNMSLVYRKSKRLSQNMLEQINEFSDLAEYKINIQKSLPFYALIVKYLQKE